MENLNYSFFKSNNQKGSYNCFFSSSSHYKLDHDYLLYDLPELIRLLGKKKNVFSNELIEITYTNNKNICKIVSWDNTEQLFIIIENIDLNMSQRNSKSIESDLIKLFNEKNN